LTLLADDSLIIRAWQEIAAKAISARATDIHIEPQEHITLIRIRIDGYLHLLSQQNKSLHERLITRIKILARLDIAEQRIPQDGRICIGLTLNQANIHCRVSCLPTLYGEKIVIRLLPSNLADLALDQLGLLPEQLAIAQLAIEKPHGLILVCGPTGSGKTRTLYTFLQHLNHLRSNLCSIEDPIEIHLAGVNQVAYQPKAGLDFPTILRALLRQDPDVMMIGEIRDQATAELAIQAAQTGHLVLSTLHTQDALGAIDRLHYLGINSEALSSCLHCLSAQRLVRRICNACQNNGHSCSLCYGNGFFGRLGIHEVIPFTGELVQAYCDGASTQQLRQRAKELGYLNLLSAGLLQVSNGSISEAELYRQIQ
jgi:type IV pilus assembly protein PilB